MSDEEKMIAKLNAHAFAIWRYADPRDWDVSYDEIADATGLTYNEVRWTIQRKGWGGRIGRGHGSGGGTSQQASLAHKTKGNRFDVNNLDVVQLMEVRQ